MGGNRAMDPNDFVCFLRLQRSIVSKIAISQNQTFHHFCKTPFYLFAFLLVAFINDFKYRGGNVLEFHHLTGKRSSKFCARDFYNAAAGQRAIGCPGLDTPFGTVENPNWPHRFLLKYLSTMSVAVIVKNFHQEHKIPNICITRHELQSEHVSCQFYEKE